MDFWNSTLTEKSWKVLHELKGFDFILIGGWAAYLWTGLHKSKDLDIALKGLHDLDYLKKNFNLVKNISLRKYEIKVEEIDVDIYVPFFSRLAIPVEEIGNHTTLVQNFEVVQPELLVILKQGAEADREHSVKGQKDRIDIVTLLFFADVDLEKYMKILQEHNIQHFADRLRDTVRGFKDFTYLNMAPRELKLKKQVVLEQLKKL